MPKYVRKEVGEVANMYHGTTRIVTELAKKDDRILLIGADSAYQALTAEDRDWWLKEAHDRLINVGIAEANSATVSAGFAKQGLIPFWSEISAGAWLFMRGYNQIRQSICVDRLNVKMFGSAGIGGPSHQVIEDIAALNAIPNMMILAPADIVEVRKMLEASVKYIGPVYLRIARRGRTIFEDDYQFQFGVAPTVRDGDDVTIIGCNEWVYNGLVAAEQLAKDGIDARVVDMSTIKPLDEDAVVRAAKETGAIVTAEMTNVHSGMGSEIAAVAVENYPVPMKRVAMCDAFTHGVSRARVNEMMAAYHISIDDLVKAVRETVKRK